MRFVFPVLLVTVMALGGCRRDPPPIPADPAADTLGLAARYDTLFFDNYSSRIRLERADGIEGRFTQLSGYALLDTELGSVSVLRLVLDANSAAASGARQDVDLRGPRMLDAARYPEVIYEATTLRRDTTDNSNVNIVEGKLTLWGQQHALPLPASVRLTGRVIAINASFDLSLGTWDRTGAHDTSRVNIRVNLVARARGAASPAGSLRASQRYQDSLARNSPLVSDSASRD